MRPRETLEPIGLAAVDLLCCAFVAVFILNLQLQDSAGTPKPDSEGVERSTSALFVDLKADTTAPPPLGVRLLLGTEEVWSTRDAGSASVTWSPAPLGMAAFLKVKVPPGSHLEVFLLAPPADGRPVQAQARVTGGGRVTTELTAANFYRQHLPWPGP